jgi:DNA-binding LytR/AlgR family response regulator
MKIKCLIVDDEPLAQSILQKYISSLPSLELVKVCNNALEALAYLHQHSVDLMFLDIKMPEISGLDMLKTITEPPKVIITTAHSEYAMEGYEYSVVDYLLKPFSFERFLKAVNKVIQKEEKLSRAEPNLTETAQTDCIFLKVDKTHQKVKCSEILYIEGYGNFIKVFLENNKMILVAETMTNIEKRLPDTLFIRIHKSYIVSIQKITQIGSHELKIGNKSIPIGSLYKMKAEEVLKRMGALKNK